MRARIRRLKPASAILVSTALSLSLSACDPEDVAFWNRPAPEAYPLPPTLDLRTYHIVDISAEPYDGDQTHSENSVLRGTLTN